MDSLHSLPPRPARFHIRGLKKRRLLHELRAAARSGDVSAISQLHTIYAANGIPFHFPKAYLAHWAACNRGEVQVTVRTLDELKQLKDDQARGFEEMDRKLEEARRKTEAA